MQKKINTNFALKDRGYSNYEDSTELSRHRWYYYKEGFSPNLVEKAIEKTKITKNDLIIDPFNGSGTTTLTASLLGYNSIGIEVNPFTSFLSDAKVRNAKISQLNRLENQLIKSIKKGKTSPLLGYSTFSENKNLEKWLFNDQVLNSFEGGWNYANSISGTDIRKLVQLSLISAAMQNCNAKKDGKCLRYTKSWKTKNFDKDSFVESLEKHFLMIKTDVHANPIAVKAKIFKGDCRSILKTNEKINNFKLCITSPPYLNTFDYTDIYRPELFLGKFIQSQEMLRKLRHKTVRSHIQVKWKDPKLNNFGSLYEKAMEHIDNNIENLMNKNIPKMIQAYFEDMFQILKLLKENAAKDAEVWFVVSNSAYADYEVPVDLIIGEVASQAGWFLKEIGVLRYVKKRKTNYSLKVTHLRESVIILSNSKF